MTRLSPCPSCGQHLFVGTPTCPHCSDTFGTQGSRPGLGSTGLALGLLLTATAACSPTMKYGTFDTDTGPVALDDLDGDGYFAGAQTDADCDDSNADIHPGATETPDDSIDSNCDGADNT